MVSRITDRPIIIRRSSRLSSRSRSSSRTRSKSQYRGSDSETDIFPPTSVPGASATHHPKILTIDYLFDNTLPTYFMLQEILSLTEKLKISKWKHLIKTYGKEVAVANTKLKRISGALTNAIYKVEFDLKELDNQNSNPAPLLLRVYGPNVSSVIDREYELSILTRLSHHNIGAKLLGCFSNGRFEQWLNHTAPLTRDLMRDDRVSHTIARRMRELHEGIPLTNDEINNGSIVWLNIEKWMGYVKDFVALQREKKKLHEETLFDEYQVFGTSFEEFAETVNVYKQWLFAKYGGEEGLKSRLVFCHNDTQYGNLLLTYPTTLSEKRPSSSKNESKEDHIDMCNPNSHKASLTDSLIFKSLRAIPTPEDRKLIVIDFEYSGPNVAAYDIADHLCEWMADYHDPDRPHYLDQKSYPTVEEQLAFVGSYVGAAPLGKIPLGVLEKDHYSDANKNNNNGDDDDDLALVTKRLYNEIVYWRPAAHISWCLWGIVQSPSFCLQPENDPVTSSNLPDDGTYKVVSDLKDLQINNNNNNSEEMEEEVGGDTDTFDYFRYSNNKAGLVWNDLFELGVVDREKFDIKGEEGVKFYGAGLFEV